MGLIGFRLRIKSFIGLFAVGEKDGNQRLIIDARSANDLHRRAPYAPFASSSAVSEVLLNAAGPAGEGNTAVPHGSGTFIATPILLHRPHQHVAAVCCKNRRFGKGNVTPNPPTKSSRFWDLGATTLKSGA